MSRDYKPLPHASELWELFDYKPLTGELVRKRGVKGGKLSLLAGGPTTTGYRSVCINYQRYQVHRLVWAWCKGSDPGSFELDHRDRNRGNNSIWNLRLATSPQNKTNTPVRPHSKTQIKGVELLPSGNYRARINSGGSHRSIGVYPTAEEAGAAYAEASRALHGEFSPYSQEIMGDGVGT